MISYILAVLVGALFLGVDQYTKAYIAENFTLAESRDFIDGFIDLVYIHNRGGAWGMLSGHTWVLISLTLVIMLICVVMLIKYGVKNKIMFWAICLVLSGGLGNMIDRIFRGGNVVDFLHFEFFPQFPVFNVADCAVVIGAGLLIVYFVIGIIEDSKPQELISEPNSNEKLQEASHDE